MSRFSSIIIVLAFAVGALYLQYSKYYLPVQTNIEQGIEFFGRDALGQSPKLFPSIKFIYQDDRTVAMLDRGNLLLEDWAQLLATLCPRKPKYIMFDKVFGLVGQQKEGAKIFNSAMKDCQKNYGVSISALAFAPSKKIRGRQTIKDDNLVGINTIIGEMPEWINSGMIYPYGPSDIIADSFDAIGHAVIETKARYRPFYFNQNNKILPHLGLFVGNGFKIEDNRLFSNGHEIFLDMDHRIPVNLLHTHSIIKNVRSLKYFLNGNQRIINWVKQGDIVIIAPHAFTGSADIKDTPIGRLLGVQLLGSIVNSTITGNWIQPYQIGGLLIVVFGILSWLICFNLRPIHSLVSAALFCVSIPTMAVLFFTYHNVTFPWVFPTAQFILTSASLITLRSMKDEIRAKTMRAALSGMLPKGQVDKIISKRGIFSQQAEEKILSIMFIDMEGYSKIAEMFSAEDCFKYLREIIGDMTTTVHKWNGTVNKTVGDGMICYFGYDHSRQEDRKNHASEAFNCAREIQKNNIDRIIEFSKDKKPIFPLRIGINTAPVFIGDVGSKDRLDYTVIGNGVNYAARLETACESHRIMLGNSTNVFLADHSKGLKKRFIQIKHHAEPLEAYECDPFANEEKKLRLAKEAFWKYFDIEKSDERHTAPEKGIKVLTDVGEGYLVDFSISGISIRLDNYIAKGLQTAIRLDMEDTDLADALKKEGLYPVLAEVRWGRPGKSGYVHGMQIKALNDDQRVAFINVLRSYSKKYLSLTGERLEDVG